MIRLRKTQTKPETSYYLNLFAFPRDVKKFGTNDSNAENPQTAPAKGVDIQLLIDTGASVSIMNYETFTEINRIQPLKLEKSNIRVRAANLQPIPMLGKCKINLSYNSINTYHVTHEFWVYKPKIGHQNLLGMDFLNKEVSAINFKDHTLTPKRFPNGTLAIESVETMNAPYCSRIYNLTSYTDFHIQPNTVRMISFRRPNILNKIPKLTSFIPNRKSLNTNLLFFESSSTVDSKDPIPIVVENPTDHVITWQKGVIGYLSLEPATPRGQNPFKQFQPVNYTAFVGAVTAFQQCNYTFETETEAEHIINSIQEYPENEQSTSRTKNPQTPKVPPRNARDEDETEQRFLESLNFTDPETLPTAKLNANFEKLTKNATSKTKEHVIHSYSEYPQDVRSFLQKFDFTEADINTSEKKELILEILKSRDVYSQHKYDVGTIKQKFHVKLQPNAELKRQRPSKVAIHYQERLQVLLKTMQEAGIIREMGSELEMGTEFFNPVIIIPKGNVIKLVIDARYLNSITDLTTYSWPLEPFDTLITRVRGQYFTTSDLSSAYHQVPLTDETKKLVSFVIGNKQYTFEKGFYGLSGLPNFFSRIMTIHFAPLIEKGDAISYIDDVLLQAENKTKMMDVIKEYHALLRKSNLKASPEKTKFFLRKVQFLGHMVSGKGISPMLKRVEDLKNLKSPENKRDVMRALGCLIFYSRYIENLQIKAKPLYELIKDETIFEWTPEHEKVFQDIKDSLRKNTIGNSKCEIPISHTRRLILNWIRSDLTTRSPGREKNSLLQQQTVHSSRTENVNTTQRISRNNLCLANIRTLDNRIKTPDIRILRSSTNFVSVGTERSNKPQILQVPNDHNTIPEFKNYLDRRKKPRISRSAQQKLHKI